MQKIRIGIDIDDTVVLTIKHLINLIGKRLDKKVNFEDVTKAYDWTILGLNEEEDKMIYTNWYKEENFNFPLCIEAKKFIEEFSEKVDIFFVTARTPEFHESTKTYFNNHFPGLKFEVFHTLDKEGNKKTKDLICSDNNIRILIEDDPVHLGDFKKGNVKCLLIERPWNKIQKLPGNVIRVKNWEEIRDKVREELLRS
jgi:uncharacterized HAD superfamily protein